MMLQLAYLPHRRRDLVLDDESVDVYVPLDSSTEAVDEKLREEKRTKKTGLLSWLKPRVCEIPFTYNKCCFLTKSLTLLCTWVTTH